MPIQSGTDIDMTRDTLSATTFVKDKDAQEFSLSDYYSLHGNGASMMNTYPMADVNDLSLTDVWEGAASTLEGVKDFGKSVLQNVGLINKAPEPVKPEEKPLPIKPELPKQPQVKTQSEEAVSKIQTYFQNPTPSAKYFIGNMKYAGPINGKLENKIKNIVAKLETELNNLFNTRRFSGTILYTTPEDIENALTHAASYKEKISKNIAVSSSFSNKDKIFYKLGKKLITKQ